MSDEPEQNSGTTLGGVAKVAAVGSVGATVANVATAAAGFTAGGVVKGPIAAAAQSYWYGAVTTGVFSYLQSVGTAGVVGPVGLVGAGIAGAGYWLWSSKSSTEIKDNNLEKNK